MSPPSAPPTVTGMATTLYVPPPALRRSADTVHLAGVALLSAMALPPLALAFAAGVFTLAHGAFGTLALLALNGVATAMPAAVFAAVGDRTGTRTRLLALLAGCAGVAALPLGYALTLLG